MTTIARELRNPAPNMNQELLNLVGMMNALSLEDPDADAVRAFKQANGQDQILDGLDRAATAMDL